MEREEIVEKLSEFLTDYYYNELITAISEGEKSVSVDFFVLDKFDPILSDYLLENPDEVLLACDDAIKQIDLPSADGLKVRFFNLPESKQIRIRNIRAEHIGKLIAIDGIVKRASEIRPQVSEAIFQCPSCGNNISILQTGTRLQMPAECECGNKKNFEVIGRKLFDARWTTVEEPFEITSGERPSEITIFLKEDLTTPKMQNKTDPGNKIKVVGVLKEIPRRVRGSRSRQLDIYIDANSVEALEVEWEELEIKAEDEQRIIELAKDPAIYEKLVNSIAPTIYGHEEIKESIVLQMIGGENHQLKDGTTIRGYIHILVIGDPAAGKSKMMQLTARLMPRGRYVSGRGVTAAGLTASVVRDEEFFGGWVLEAGALVMSNRSLCAIDEFSKVTTHDQVALQEAMSLGTISIAKASIVATLPAQTAILAGGNPKLGRFDPYIPIREQIDINDVLMSRFDLKFALRDMPNPELDARTVDHILKLRHLQPEEAAPSIEPDLLRKYIAYVRANVHPELIEETGEILKKFYLEMRSRAGGEAAVSITLRQYEALIRLAEASAKIRLSDKVETEDAMRAIRLMKISLRQFGLEPETGMIDIDRAEGQPVTAAQRSKIRMMLDLIDTLIGEFGKVVPEEEIIRRGERLGIRDAEQILRKMLNEGVLFSPKPSFVQKVP